jgi:hypothetical protein
MKISKVINLFHTGISIYLSLGWILSPIHNKILVGWIPCVFVNWLLDDNQCLLTRIEHHFLKKKHIKDVKYEGFISKKLNSLNIELTEKEIDNILVIILFHSFLQSYKNILL